MVRRSVSDSIRPLRSGPPGLSTTVAPRVTKKMMAEACRSLVQRRHPSSSQGTGPPADVAGAWTQEVEGEALREPPAVRRETSSTPKTEEKGLPRRPEPQPGSSGWNPSLLTSAGGRPAQGGTEKRRCPRSARDDGGLTSLSPHPPTNASVTHRHGPHQRGIEGLFRLLGAQAEPDRLAGRWRWSHRGTLSWLCSTDWIPESRASKTVSRVNVPKWVKGRGTTVRDEGRESGTRDEGRGRVTTVRDERWRSLTKGQNTL